MPTATHSDPASAASTAPVPSERGVAIIAAVLLIVGLAAAISVDVVKNGFGVKSDEATYVSMALSIAYDGNLSYERRDLDRYFGFYRFGPDGIFLKRGKRLHANVDATPPFVHLTKTPDVRSDRLYFGKAMIYPLVAAPLVRLFGLNGLLVLNVLLLFGVGVCGYTFLAARSRPGPALAFTLAFIGAACIPVYVVFLLPEVFNFALVSFAGFLWLYKEVAPSRHRGVLTAPATDIVAAILIGIVTYSKINHGLLIGPIVLWLWWRRRYVSGLLVAAVFAMTMFGLFWANALVTGEFNYQGGDRKSFVGHFPFDGSPESAWDRRGTEMSTNDADLENVLEPAEFPARFAHNVEYFLAGRHFGFIPYFFPGVVCIVLWLMSRERSTSWRILTFLAVAGSAVAWLIIAPYTWSGGGGPPGNRYFMSQYAWLLFLTPPLTAMTPALVAWIGGALFTAKILVNPFYAAKFPYTIAERGFARRLPVELTMANDLPIMLDTPRTHIWFADVMLYFLDQHAYVPEVIDKETGKQGIWVAGDGRADILVRSEWPIDHLTITAESPIATRFIVSIGSRQSDIAIAPGKPVTFDVPASGVRALKSYAYLLSARSTDAFTPHLLDPSALNPDPRNLGVLMTFKAVPRR
jgi:hypothetical protein